jgi:aerobic carbon-monoxide dehydrogenase medium subunit
VSRFDYHEPTSIAEAVELSARFGDEGRFLAGGTDLLIQIDHGRVAPRHVVSLHRVPGLATIEANGRISLGTCVTHRTIENRPEFRGRLQALIEGAQVIGGHQVRNVATVGGNIVNASPAADLVPVLLTLDADVTLLGAAGERVLPLTDFLVGPGRTARSAEELLLRVTAPHLPASAATAFLKAGRRKAMEIAVVCVAVRVTVDPARRLCHDVRIALGAVAPTTTRAPTAERVVEGQTASSELFREAGDRAAAACDPISDVRASARFRRHLVGTLVMRALARAVERVERVA